jgi:hypothetical protein
MEDTLHFIYEEYNGRRAKETPSYFLATVRCMKAYNERLTRAQDEQVELNVVLLQSLPYI